MEVTKHNQVFQIIILTVLFSVGRFECLPLSELCPEICCCHRTKAHGKLEGLKADCSRKNLTSVPAGLSNMTTELNLSYNSFTDLPAEAFSHLTALKELLLINSDIKTLHSDALTGLEELQILSLDDNQIKAVAADSFQQLPLLRILTLEGNLLSAIPTEALAMCTNLHHLHLGSNRITDIPEYAFRNNSYLTSLILSKNAINHLYENAFSGLMELSELAITSNPIQSVAGRAFAKLPMLEELILDRCSISTVLDDLCLEMPNLRKLDLHSNDISAIPNLSKCSKLSNLHLGVNKIASLEGQPFRGLSSILDLTLKSNDITSIPADAFVGLTQVEYLDLSDNVIDHIHEDAFIHFDHLQNLNLAHNRFPSLPSKGLHNLILLQTAHNEHLHEIPSPTEMPVIERIVTAYPYHCCQFIGGMTGGGGNSIKSQVTEEHIWLQGSQFNWMMFSQDSLDYNISGFESIDTKSYYGSKSEYNFPLASGGQIDYLSQSLSDYLDAIVVTVQPPIKNISCIPQPDAFMPCSDLFGSWFLRIGVWLVFLLALIGNGIVILVIIFSRTKVDVSRFLICNLACADFAMGIYLGFLAGVDAATLGVFRKYGVDWQLSEGCGAASFLAVFSSELSIYTLCVITLERFYAIKHALHLEKRLKLQHAIVIMCFGWMFALVVASMPLFGVNSYYRYPVCLPFDISTKGALAYVSGLMLLNGFAFVVIMLCYISIYCAIQGSHAWNCNDSRVARRMSLLVFTDFACWAPIAFFGLTSAFNIDLISLDGAKILTVFVLPVNSCANPFLYTILTKQFKKDCRVILQWFNNKTCTSRRNSRSVTLSLARQASLRSTMQHPVSQNRWKTSASGSQDVGILDPALLAQKKPNLVQVTEKASPEQSCVISEWPTPLKSRIPHQTGHYNVDDPTSHLSPSDAQTIRRSSTSPLLERAANKEANAIKNYDKKKARKMSMLLWMQKRIVRNSEKDLTEVDSHKQCRRYSFSEGVFCNRKGNNAKDERKTPLEPTSNATTSQNMKGERYTGITKANNSLSTCRASSEKSIDCTKKRSYERNEKRSPCSPKHLWRQRSPILTRAGDSSEIQGLLDQRKTTFNDIIAPEKKQITTVSLEVTNRDVEQMQICAQANPVQRPDNLNLNWKSADTLDSGNITGSPSNSELHNFSGSEDESTPITVTPCQEGMLTVNTSGPYPKILITRLDSFSNILPDSPTETHRRLDKSRESVV